MSKRNLIRALLCTGLCAPVWAQEAPKEAPPPQPAPPEPPKQASAPAEAPKDGEPLPQEVKVLKPVDVPAEKLRIKTKADIKCEVTLVPAHGREVTVKGVVRNGKLIERFVGRVFVEEPTVENTQSGVRLWWVDNTAGWIFLRYSQIKTIALTGILTAEERQEILRKLLAAEKEKADEQKAREAASEEDLVKMPPAELEAYLLREYPADKGWNHERLRELKKKQLIDNQPLAREESIFVSYFPVLIKARMKDLKREKDKVEFEPGSAQPPAPPAGGQPAQGQPVRSGEPREIDVPGQDLPSDADDEPLPEDEEE
jgi:hypothetical protein